MLLSGNTVLSFVLLYLYMGVLGLLSIYGLHRWHLVWLAMRHSHSSPPPLPQLDPLPRVTVQLPIFNERYVIGRLLRAACRLDYPRHLLEIQVLDDSTDGTSPRLARMVRLLARRGYDIKHLSRTQREGFKAGALAAGTRQAHGEFVAIFDADFLPSPGFLKATLPAFQDPEVGMVQTRWGHLNRKASLLTRLQAILLDGHFLVEHLARNRSGRFFNFNGTAGIWRLTCIEAAGGWQHETLTEDLDLSYRAQLKGWRFLFLPDVVTPAELPAGMGAFKSQQHRWAKGSAETALKLLGRILTARHLPLATRIEAFFHLTENFAYLLMILLVLLLWPSISIRRQMNAGLLSFIDLPVFLLASLSVACFYLQSQRRAGQGWRASLASIPAVMGLGMALALNNGGAVLEALAGHKSPFIRTPKEGLTDGRRRQRGMVRYRSSASVWPLLESIFAVYLALALLDVARQGGWAWLPFLTIFFWGFASTATLGWLEFFPRAAPGHTADD